MNGKPCPLHEQHSKRPCKQAMHRPPRPLPRLPAEPQQVRPRPASATASDSIQHAPLAARSRDLVLARARRSTAAAPPPAPPLRHKRRRDLGSSPRRVDPLLDPSHVCLLQDLDAYGAWASSSRVSRCRARGGARAGRRGAFARDFVRAVAAWRSLAGRCARWRGRPRTPGGGVGQVKCSKVMYHCEITLWRRRRKFSGPGPQTPKISPKNERDMYSRQQQRRII